MNLNALAFEPSELQEDLRDLVKEIIDKYCDDDRVASLDADPEAWDTELYASLVEAGVLAAVIGDDEESGMGNAGLMYTLVEAGRGLARTPIVSTAVAGLALAAAGRLSEVEAVSEGEMTVALALPERLHTVKVMNGRLQGSVGLIHSGRYVSHFLVADDSGALYLAPSTLDGVHTVDTGFSYVKNVAATFDIPVDQTIQLEHVGREFLEQRWRTALSAFVIGACKEAVERTAAYTSERKQFGATLSAKQAVLIQAADAHIDTDCIFLTTLDAASRLDCQDPAAETAVAVAAWWANDAGFRIVHATQHLHGGMGADRDNHIHRFFVFVREASLVLGASDDLLHQIGTSVAYRSQDTSAVSQPENQMNHPIGAL